MTICVDAQRKFVVDSPKHGSKPRSGWSRKALTASLPWSAGSTIPTKLKRRHNIVMLLNEHIRKGNEAIRNGDRNGAATEFYEALADSDPTVQRIARNRLLELFPETVFASTHSYQKLHHRPNCAAKNAIWKNHIVWFQDWRQAEAAGCVPCHMCKPMRVEPRIPLLMLTI